jgi:exosortase
LQSQPDTSPEGSAGSAAPRFEILVSATLLVVWVPGLLELAETWRHVDYASHGFLVPLVALWAATAHRAELARLPARPMRGGWLLLASVSAVYLAALALRAPTLLGLAAVATVVAAVLALRGVRWARTLCFPLAYLLFMVPLPGAWVTPVIVRLQLLMSSLGVAILRAAGVPIYRDGNVLLLPGDVSLFVAEACSGITSLVTLIPIAVFIAYFTESRLGRRIVLVAAVVPIALAGNLLRVIVTVGVAMELGVEVATAGPLHEWAGVTTYVVACLALLGLGGLLRRLWPEREAGP